MFRRIGDYRVLRALSGLNHERFLCLTPEAAGRRSLVELSYRRFPAVADETPQYLTRRAFCTPDIPQVLALGRVNSPPRGAHAAILSHPGGVTLREVADHGGRIPDEILLNIVGRIASAARTARDETDFERDPVVLLAPSLRAEQIFIGFDGALSVPVWPMEQGFVLLLAEQDVYSINEIALALLEDAHGTRLHERFTRWLEVPPTLNALDNELSKRQRRAPIDDEAVGRWLSALLPEAYALEQDRRGDWEIGGTEGALETGPYLSWNPLGYAG